MKSLSVFITLLSLTTHAATCHIEKIGTLNPTIINEASGLVVSKNYPDRLYHINDSGSENILYITNLSGQKTKKLLLENTPSVDTETMTAGPCPEAGQCLFIGDTGDNFKWRSTIQIFIFKEPTDSDSSIKNIKTLNVTYPDGPHDAEAMALSPNGDLYILTKERRFLTKGAKTAMLFRLSKAEWHNAKSEKLVLTKVSELDLPTLATTDLSGGKVITDMNISSDGSRLLLMTYVDAFEFKIDSDKITFKAIKDLIKDIDYREIPLQVLKQQEAVSYLPDGSGFIYTTESNTGGEIMKVSCPKF